MESRTLVLRLLASEFEVPVSIAAKCKVKCKMRKQWLAARFNKCFGTSTGNQPGTKKMNTKEAATDKDSFLFEDSARRGSVDFIFCGIHTFSFINHSSQARKDLTPPFPGGDGSCGPQGIGVGWERSAGEHDPQNS
jgi:hypothetical protein